MRISDWSSDVCSSDLGKQEEGKNEQACRQRIEIGFHVRVAVDRIGGEQPHCGLEQIVIKRAQELGCEYRQKHSLAAKLKGCLQVGFFSLFLLRAHDACNQYSSVGSVGEECVSTDISRWCLSHIKQNKYN